MHFFSPITYSPPSIKLNWFTRVLHVLTKYFNCFNDRKYYTHDKNVMRPDTGPIFTECRNTYVILLLLVKEMILVAEQVLFV